MRNFGIMSDRQRLSGASSTLPAATQDNYASRDSNSSEASLDRKALAFALSIAGPLLVASVVLLYLGFV